ncbi:MAG: glycoside hydrolase family 16 protein [Candidatus Delongbacteria bacterium]
MTITRRRRSGPRPALGALALLATLAGCSREHDPPAVLDYQLVWQDEFEGPVGEAPDPARWVHDVGTNWGNSQLEYDTERVENAALDGAGHLAITARRESWLGSDYTSARLTTRGLFEPRYGRFEARLRLPSGRGLWPAFWLLGANIGEVSWPHCGEIDIMEARGQLPSINHTSLHGPGYSGGGAVTSSQNLFPLRLDEDFHVYALEWERSTVRWLLDDVVTFEVDAGDLPGDWVFDHPFFLILNVAVGGTFVGPPDAGTVFPQTLLVDWVRVYQQLP